MSTLLQMSIMGGVIICLVILFRVLFQYKVRRSTILLLWFIAVIRLMLPVIFQARTSIYNLPAFDGGSILTGADAALLLPAIHDQGWTVSQILTLIWAVGAALIFLAILVLHVLSCRRYRFSVPACVTCVPIPRGIRVRTLDGLRSPLTFGILSPTILLPTELVQQGGIHLKYVLLHELAHIKHHDVLKKLMVLLTAVVHWFNPLVWLMVYLVDQDIEMQCDTLVVDRMGGKARLTYAKTLVAAEETKLVCLLQTGFSSSSTASRLMAMAKAKPLPIIGRCLAVVMALLLAFCFLPGQVAHAMDASKITAILGKPDFLVIEPEPESEIVTIFNPPEPHKEPLTIPTEPEEPEPTKSVPEPEETPVETVYMEDESGSDDVYAELYQRFDPPSDGNYDPKYFLGYDPDELYPSTEPCFPVIVWDVRPGVSDDSPGPQPCIPGYSSPFPGRP